jgi:type II secretory pathway pseudopilin PulG
MSKLKDLKKQRGFALLEVALAVIIAASVFLATIEFLDISTHRASAQRIGQEINEIFNAAISYYLVNGDSWPQSMQDLVDAGLLPKKPTNPWSYPYKVDNADSTVKKTDWTLGTCLPNSVATNLAALLPFGTIADSTQDNCGTTAASIKYVTTKINQTIGGQKDNLSIVMVKSGDRVGAPACPIAGGKQYEPHIYLLPAAFDANGHVISAMSARADTLNKNDPDYPNGSWKVYLDLTTDMGTNEDTSNNPLSSQPAVMAAFTDCKPKAS